MMRIVRDLEQVPAAGNGRILAIGNFDGVHLGHRKILSAAVARSREAGCEATVLTFDPHPTLVLRPDLPHDMLTTFEDKAEQFSDLGMDLTICVHFDEAFAARSPENFVKTVLAPLAVREVYVGANYKFGMARAGNVDTLTDLGRRYGFTVHPESVYTMDGRRVSSSRIRRALWSGDVAAATHLLGRPYCLKGQVVRGASRGRSLGFPTANLRLPEELVPANGVYAGHVAVSDPPEGPEVHPEWFDAVIYIGTRPTFAEEERLIEVHLLDMERDLYGHRIRAEFLERVRPEMSFASGADLAAQIHKDVARAREVLGR